MSIYFKKKYKCQLTLNNYYRSAGQYPKVSKDPSPPSLAGIFIPKWKGENKKEEAKRAFYNHVSNFIV